MREIFAGLVLIAGLVVLLVSGSRAMRHAPHSWLGRLFLEPLFHRSTGAYKVASRRDLRVRGGLVLAAAAIMLLVAILVGQMSTALTPLSTARISFNIYAAMAGVLAVLFALSGLGDLIGSLWGRPVTIRRTPETVVADLRDMLTTLSHSGIDVELWPDFAAIRYAHPALEAVRRKLVETFPHGRPPTVPGDEARLRELVAELDAITA